MHARCNILATRISTGAMRCPGGMTRFHFHGVAAGPVVRILTGVAPCLHRHASQDAAERCTDAAAGRRGPIRLSDVARTRRRAAARAVQA